MGVDASIEEFRGGDQTWSRGGWEKYVLERETVNERDTSGKLRTTSAM